MWTVLGKRGRAWHASENGVKNKVMSLKDLKDFSIKISLKVWKCSFRVQEAIEVASGTSLP